MGRWILDQLSLTRFLSREINASYSLPAFVFDNVARLAPIVQKVDHTIHWLNLCLMDGAIG